MTTKRPKPGRTSDAAALFETTARQVMAIAERVTKNTRSGVEECAVAEGMLDAAISFWLHVHQPCGRPWCETCKRLDAPEKRLAVLALLVERIAREGPAYHAEHDVKDAGAPATVQ